MALQRRTWHLDDFAGGIDTRDGAFSRDQNRFRLLTNYVLTNGKKIRRRWPYVASGLTLPTPSQGLIPFANGLRTIQRREDVDGGTYDVEPLAFDTPDNCGEGWELVDWAIFETTVLALIRHDFTHDDYPSIVRLHVLGEDDSQLPTYVEDPYCPNNWKGGILVDPTPGAYVEDWTPRITVSQGKAYVSLPNGDVAFCKTGNPRAWNVKTIVTLSEVGQELAFVIPDDGAALKQWTLAEAYADFQTETLADQYRFTAYVLEWYDEDAEEWTVIPEVRVQPTADKTWRVKQVAHRKGGTDNEAQVQLYWTGDPAIIRLRMILDERSSSLSGAVITVTQPTFEVAVAIGTHEITRDGVTSEYDHAALATVAVGGNPVWIALDDTGEKRSWGSVTDSGVSVLTDPPTGYERWRNHIHRYLQINAAGSYPSAAMSIDATWQAVRKVGLALYAGDADAGVISSSGHTGAGGGEVTAMAVIRQRLLLWYGRSSQLWQVGTLAASHELIDTGLIGTGTQDTPEPAPLEGSVVIATPQGLRQFSIESLNEAYIREIGIGDQLRKLVASGAVPTQHAATYWPLTGEYVTAVTLAGESFVLAFDYAPASEVAGWSKWTMVDFGVPDRKGLVAVDDKLYVRSGDVLRCWDASGTTFRDVTDPVGSGNAYESKSVWHFNDFKDPSTIKVARSIDVVQTGTGNFSIRYNPADERWETAAIPISGSTVGRGKVPLMATGPAFALVLTSTDEDGHELESVAIEFTARSR